jgi:hypothetical protein
MPAPLQTTQTPNPIPVDTPDIVKNLDTNTGPEAQPQEFGPSLVGLAQGTEEAGQEISTAVYRSRYYQRQQQAAANELAATTASIQYDKEISQRIDAAKAIGQTIDPDQFDSELAQRQDEIMAGLKNPEQQAMFQRNAITQRYSAYKTALGANAGIAVKQNENNYQTVSDQFVNSVDYTKPIDRQLSDYDSKMAALRPAVDNGPVVDANARAKIIANNLTNTGQTQGYGALANQIRSLTPAHGIPIIQGEVAATNANNAEKITIGTQKLIADQQLQKVKQDPNSTPGEIDQAASNEAIAQTRQPTTQNPPQPSLVQQTQEMRNRYAALRDSINAENPLDVIRLRGHEEVETQYLGRSYEAKFATENLDQQQEEALALQQAFPGHMEMGKDGESKWVDDPMVVYAQKLFSENQAMLTPGSPRYAPAVAAIKNPTVLTALTNAQNAIQAAGKDPVKLGQAQGLMHTAITTNFAAQRLLGIPAGQEQVLTPDQAKTLGEQASMPSNAKKVYEQVQQTYGSYAPQAMQEAFSKKGMLAASTALAFLNPNDEQVWAAAQFQSPTKLSEPERDTILSAIRGDAGFTAWQKANASNVNGPQTAADYAEGLITHAQYYMASGMDAATAAKTAVAKTIGKAFTTADSGNGHTMAIPSQIAPTSADVSDLTNKANQAVADMVRNGVQFKSDAGIIDPATLTRMGAGEGHWVFDKGNGSPQDARLVLNYETKDGSSVRALMPDGRRIAFSVQGLKGSSLVSNLPEDQLSQFADAASEAGVPFTNILKYQIAAPSFVRGAWKLNVDPNSLLPPPQTGKGINPPASMIPAAVAPAVNPAKVQITPMTKNAPSVTGFETTHYGYADDTTPDSYTREGLGAGGPLRPGDVAITKSLAARFGLNVNARDKNNDFGKQLDLINSAGHSIRVRVQDLAPEDDDRIDIYDPAGSEAGGVPFNATQARLVTNA